MLSYVGDDLGPLQLSGQGQLNDFTPGSSSSGTGYDSLSLYLVSDRNNVNLTISTDFLTGEPGSNVKHPEFRVPDCLPQGNYNVSVVSFLSNTSLTPLPS